MYTIIMYHRNVILRLPSTSRSGRFQRCSTPSRAPLRPSRDRGEGVCISCVSREKEGKIEVKGEKEEESLLKSRSIHEAVVPGK